MLSTTHPSLLADLHTREILSCDLMNIVHRVLLLYNSLCLASHINIGQLCICSNVNITTYCEHEYSVNIASCTVYTHRYSATQQ